MSAESRYLRPIAPARSFLAIDPWIINPDTRISRSSQSRALVIGGDPTLVGNVAKLTKHIVVFDVVVELVIARDWKTSLLFNSLVLYHGSASALRRIPRREPQYRARL